MQLSRRKFLQALAAIPAIAGVTKITGDWLLPDEPSSWETGINVDSTMNFAEGDCIRIGDELMYITGISASSLTVVRGYGPSVPQSFDYSTPVYLVQRARQEYS
jgi:hypothetical protein